MDRIKEGFRWFAVIPGALVGGFLAQFPIHWAVMLFKFLPDSGDHIVTNSSGESLFHAMNASDLEFMGYALITPAIIILVGSRIAPKRHFEVAIGIAILIVCGLCWGLYSLHSMSNVRSITGAVPLWVTVLLWIASIATALIKAHDLRKANFFESSGDGA